MRKVSMATRRELVAAVGERYRAADRASKDKVLDEFVAVTGLHRKHAMQILRQKALSRQTARPERRIYTEAVRTALIVLWEASDRLCGKRLRPLIPVHCRLKTSRSKELRSSLIAVIRSLHLRRPRLTGSGRELPIAEDT